MKKLLFVGLLALSANLVRSQDAVLFKIKFLPNHTYHISSSLSGTINTDLSANKEIVAKLSQQGFTQPLVASISYSNNSIATTGGRIADNSFPITIVKGETPQFNFKINDKPLPIPAPKQADSKFYGHIGSDGKLNLDSLAGKKLDDSATVKIKKTINNLMGAINFPDHKLKVGETFVQNVPFNMPMGGSGMAMDIKITYKLVSISNGLAYFDLDQAIDMKLNVKGVNASVTGHGAGKMIYDIGNSYTQSSKSDFKLFITVQSDKLNVVATANFEASNSYQISQN